MRRKSRIFEFGLSVSETLAPIYPIEEIKKWQLLYFQNKTTNIIQIKNKTQKIKYPKSKCDRMSEKKKINGLMLMLC